MTWLALILAIAALGFGVARWARIPVIPLLLFAGLGLSLLGLAPREILAQNTVELGLNFLVFAAGMELNPTRFGQQRKAVLWVGIVQFAVMGTCGFGLSRLLGFGVAASVYLAIALATSSTLVVVHQLKQWHQMFEPFGRLVIGVLLIQDLLMIFLIVLLAHLPLGAWAVVRGQAGVLLMSGIALGCQHWLMPFLIRHVKPDEETLLLAVLALLFAMVSLALYLGMPPVVGAFLAGVSLSGFPVNGVVRGLLTPLSDFFQALFFTALGSLVVIPDLFLVCKALLLALLVLLVTPPLVTIVAEVAGLTSRPAMEAGLLLAQTSEFALVLGLTGSERLGHISPDILSIIVLFTVLTMTLTPFVATDQVVGHLLRWHPLRWRVNEASTRQQHILMLGFGTGGRWVIKPLLQSGHDVLVVDDDPVVIEQLKKAQIPCLRGDGADEKVLARANANRAKLILASMRRVSDAEKVLQQIRHIPVIVRVFEAAEADHIRDLGGVPILNSQAAAETFMEWFEKACPKPLRG